MDGSKELSLEPLPALSPKAGECAYTGAEDVVTGGAERRGLRRTGGMAGGTSTLDTGGVGTGGGLPPLAAWLHGVGRLDGGGGGVVGLMLGVVGAK